MLFVGFPHWISKGCCLAEWSTKTDWSTFDRWFLRSENNEKYRLISAKHVRVSDVLPLTMCDYPTLFWLNCLCHLCDPQRRAVASKTPKIDARKFAEEKFANIISPCVAVWELPSMVSAKILEFWPPPPSLAHIWSRNLSVLLSTFPLPPSPPRARTSLMEAP